jgi:hypothetical protein
MHMGVDYKTPSGTPVRAVADGEVSVINPNSATAGYLAELKHDGGGASRYFHLTPGSGCPVGTKVSAGDVIALSDNTGVSTAPHLHFEYTPIGSAKGLLVGRVNPVNCMIPWEIPDPTIHWEIEGEYRYSYNNNTETSVFPIRASCRAPAESRQLYYHDAGSIVWTITANYDIEGENCGSLSVQVPGEFKGPGEYTIPDRWVVADVIVDLGYGPGSITLYGSGSIKYEPPACKTSEYPATFRFSFSDSTNEDGGYLASGEGSAHDLIPYVAE